MPVSLQHALSNKIATGSSNPMSAKEYSISKKIHVQTTRNRSPKGNTTCQACKANARSSNPGTPPVHPNCRCKLK